MNLIEPLPEAVRAKLRHNTHPGLMLDKFAKSWDPDARDDARGGGLSERIQKPALEDVVRLSQAQPPGLVFSELLARRQRVLRAAQAATFSCRTAGPLTLHLARASALENAGICLHPVYGFTYLPGAGLKGLARSFAETVWFPAQYAGDEMGRPKDEVERKKAGDAWRCIEAVFGWAPNSDSKKPWKPREIPGHDKQDREHCGAVVFHDAWPLAWPKLMVDILNNHHAKYYQGQSDDPPGDWENPVPVYFLAVEANTTFEFAVAKRRPDVADPLLGYAREWLLGALCHLGAGAKTNSGYGTFQPIQESAPPLTSARHCVFESDVTLITPAFLAGANQQAGDCDLRPATLRGLLRWWWRTMHAGFLDVPTLRALEAAIWGDTKRGGAVRIEVTENRLAGPKAFDYKDRFEPKPDFARKHGLASRPDGKTTQGLFYAAYGMDEFSRGEQRHRYYVDAGSQWRIRLIASAAEFSLKRGGLHERVRSARATLIPAQQILDQALAALWLLCAYGGAGSKSRKGFGSLQLSDISGQESPALTAVAGLDQCRCLAAKFREEWGLPREFRLPDSPALGPPNGIPSPASIAVPWQDAWKIMDEIGFAYQAFTKLKRHDRAKAALGLPRKIHGPRDDGPMRNQSSETYRRPEWLDFPKRDRRLAPKDARHASPIHLHVSRQSDGAYRIRVLAFPAKSLPNEQTSRQVLQEFIACFEREVTRRATLPAPPRAESPRFSKDRRPDERPRTAAPAAARSLPSIMKEDLLRRLADTKLPQAVFRVVRSLDSGGYEAQQLRSAPNVPAGYQGDGGRRLVAAPDGLPEGAFVLVVLEGGRDGRYQEPIGQLPGPPRPPLQRRGPPRR